MEFFSGALIPGMVNAHTHTELSYLKGKIAPGCGFAGFADAISRLRHDVPEPERAAAAAYQDAWMYSRGVSAVGDISNSAFTFAHKASSPVAYLNFIEYFNLATTDFSATDAVAEAARELGLRYSKTPHSTYSLADAPFRAIAALGNPLSIHFMESRAEAELFEGRGSLHERNGRMGLPVDFAHYGSPAGRIVGSVPPEKDILLIHNTFVDEEVVERVENHFRGSVTWVLCPRSNAYIEGARPPVELLRRKGVRLALGTDSLASNDDLSMVEEMKLLCKMGAPLREIIRWATLGGAEALGVDDWAGSFQVGKHPGAVLLSGIDWERDALLPNAETKRIL